MKSIKDLMYAKNSMLNFSDEEIERIDQLLYHEECVTCIDAHHPDDEYENIFTWYIPAGVNFDIAPGDLLVVEQNFSPGVGFAIANNGVYEKTRAQHEQDIHPYCRVIHNLGPFEQYKK